MTKFFIAVLFLLIIDCSGQNSEKQFFKQVIDEKNYVLDDRFEMGDVRRYGIYPDSLTSNNTKHPNTGKYKIHTLLDLAEESTMLINFPSGNYGMNILIDSRENINFHFNDSEFSLIHITNEKGTESKNINLTGSLIVYNRFGTYNSQNIRLDTLLLKSNPEKSLEKLRNKGCHIYKGTKNLKIKYLKIEDLGSGAEAYRNNHAALAIDGLRNNPEKVIIDKVEITSSDRHGIYVTGKNHIFKNILIKEYGSGTSIFMSQMQDANQGDERVISGLWVNRCNNCQFDNVEIRTKNSKGHPLKLDEGKSSEPTIINTLKLDVPYEEDLVLDDILTNVLVRKIELVD